jgi:O-antigen/teichoic acid export membrane protein
MIKPVGQVAGLILGASGNIRIDNRNCVIAALLNVVCNYFFIPRFGVMGAAAASILSFTALSILHYASVRKIIFKRQGGSDTVDGAL